MTRRFAWGIGGLVLLALGAAWALNHFFAPPDIPFVDVSSRSVAKEGQDAGLCPWRDPSGDLKRYFPGATGYREELLIVSRHRQEVERRLGRVPTGEENALRIYRILQGEKPLGAIIPRRVRGESGVIELVLAVNSAGKALGAKIQRLREPEEVAKALRSDAFLGAFAGKSARSDWRLGKDFAAVAPAAQSSATALLDAARVALILLEIGNTTVAGQGTHH